MADIIFNADLDKITEQEVVYDFFDRLLAGKNTSINDVKVINKDDNIKLLLAKLIFDMPKQISSRLSNIKVLTINVSENDITIAFEISKTANICIIYSEKTGDNLTEIFKKDINYDDDNNDQYIMDIDCPYINNDVIKVYYY